MYFGYLSYNIIFRYNIMPYKIKKVAGGFKVADAKGKTFSKKPMCKKCAEKQRIAIALSESSRTGKSPTMYFA